MRRISFIIRFRSSPVVFFYSVFVFYPFVSLINSIRRLDTTVALLTDGDGESPIGPPLLGKRTNKTKDSRLLSPYRVIDTHARSRSFGYASLAFLLYTQSRG